MEYIEFISEDRITFSLGHFQHAVRVNESYKKWLYSTLWQTSEHKRIFKLGE